MGQCIGSPAKFDDKSIDGRAAAYVVPKPIAAQQPQAKGLDVHAPAASTPLPPVSEAVVLRPEAEPEPVSSTGSALIPASHAGEAACFWEPKVHHACSLKYPHFDTVMLLVDRSGRRR